MSYYIKLNQSDSYMIEMYQRTKTETFLMSCFHKDSLDEIVEGEPLLESLEDGNEVAFTFDFEKQEGYEGE